MSGIFGNSLGSLLNILLSWKRFNTIHRVATFCSIKLILRYVQIARILNRFLEQSQTKRTLLILGDKKGDDLLKLAGAMLN